MTSEPLSWKSSSRCETSSCAEVAFSPDGFLVYIRNSTDPETIVTFTRGEWHAFSLGMVQDEFDSGI